MRWIRLADKLRRLKKIVKKWQRDNTEKIQRELCYIKKELSEIYMVMTFVPADSQTYSRIELLEAQKLEILKIQETTWKLKSHVQWLQEGNLNTKFFHNCANGHRNINSI